MNLKKDYWQMFSYLCLFLYLNWGVVIACHNIYLMWIMYILRILATTTYIFTFK
jgi:hypothetical protein